MAPLVDDLAACGAVRFGDFVLTSGARSSYYVDVKMASTDPTVLAPIATQMAEQAKLHGPFDAVAGMELGAVPLATAASLETGLPLLIVRKGAREHGTGKRIEGRDCKGQRVLIVEDVTTSGGSVLQAVQVLREAGAIVEHCITVVDRDGGAEPLLSKSGVQLHPLVRASDLLDSKAAKEALA